MEEQKLKITEYILNMNILRKQSFIYNILEGVVLSVIYCSIIIAIPFTDLVTKVSCTVGTVAIIFGCIKGINEKTLTMTLLAEIKFRHNRRILHLRSPEYDKTKSTFGTSDEDLSLAEQLFTKLKQRLNEFADKYDENTSSENHEENS